MCSADYLHLHETCGLPTAPRNMRTAYSSKKRADCLQLHETRGLPTAPRNVRTAYSSTKRADCLHLHETCGLPTAPRNVRIGTEPNSLPDCFTTPPPPPGGEWATVISRITGCAVSSAGLESAVSRVISLSAQSTV